MWLIFPARPPEDLRALPLQRLPLHVTRHRDGSGELMTRVPGEMPVMIAHGSADDMAALLREVVRLASTLTPGASAVEVAQEAGRWSARYVDAPGRAAKAHERHLAAVAPIPHE